MLGIIIGVAAVIAMVGVGAGAQARVAEQIQSLGSNLIIVLSAASPRAVSGSAPAASSRSARTTPRRSGARSRWSRRSAPSVRGTAQVVYGNLNWATSIQGVTPDYFEARDWPVTDGRAITPEDVDGAAKIALVGQTTALNLFGESDPLGQIIRIKKVPFTVVGVLSRKGQNSWGQDQDDVDHDPDLDGEEEGARREPGQPALRRLHLDQGPRRRGHDRGRGADPRAPAAAPSAATVPGRRFLAPQPVGSSADAGGVVPGDDLSARRDRVRLAPGRRDRHHEHHAGVGDGAHARDRLRMAVGARRRHILLQFLIEAVTLSLIGGIIGIALGLGGSRAISYFAEWRTLVNPESIVIAFGFAAGIGIFFGFYPARKASRLDPIEALRYE
jgi:putative ABC transport system permease protein